MRGKVSGIIALGGLLSVLISTQLFAQEDVISKRKALMSSNSKDAKAIAEAAGRSSPSLPYSPDAENVGRPERVAGDGLHHDPGHREPPADHGGQERAWQADQVDDELRDVVGRGRRQQHPVEDVAEADRFGSDRDAPDEPDAEDRGDDGRGRRRPEAPADGRGRRRVRPRCLRSDHPSKARCS